MLAGSMSDASRMLYVSQPAVSRLIKDLEESLGFTLFDRRNSRLYPTQAAHAFYREVERHFIGMDNLSQAADQVKRFEGGDAAADDQQNMFACQHDAPFRGPVRDKS